MASTRTLAAPRTKANAYLELTKPRITTLVMVTAAIGMILGCGGLSVQMLPLLAVTLVGVGLTSGGAGVLNHLLEVECDSRMPRTRNRPLVTGEVTPAEALVFGVYLVLGGVLLLMWQVNLLTAFLALLTTFLYVLVYTPMKRLSWLNTLVGAVPGALPPLGGWAAARGEVEAGAWVLFAILFIWQMPHFYAIAWIFKDDYRKGGFKMLPVTDSGAVWTMRQIVFFSLLLVPVPLLLSGLHVTGPLYTVGAIGLAFVMLVPGLTLARTRSVNDARRVLRASVVYLPLLMLLIVADARL